MEVHKHVGLCGDREDLLQVRALRLGSSSHRCERSWSEENADSFHLVKVRWLFIWALHSCNQHPS